jgi:hypothetical protein
MNTKSQVDFDRSLQLNMLDNTEEDKDMSWEFYKVFDYSKEKGYFNSSNHKSQITSVWWNGMMSIRLNHG